MIRLLIVEDDSNTRLGLMDLLRQEGYWVRGAMQGRQALEVAASTPIDMVLCDYSLPDMNGLEVCHKLLRLQPQLRLFLVTAHNDMELTRRARESGVVKILNKPLNLNELFEALLAQSSDHSLNISGGAKCVTEQEQSCLGF